VSLPARACRHGPSALVASRRHPHDGAQLASSPSLQASRPPSQMTVDELKLACSRIGLRKSGNKPDLQQRLLAALGTAPPWNTSAERAALDVLAAAGKWHSLPPPQAPRAPPVAPVPPPSAVRESREPSGKAASLTAPPGAAEQRRPRAGGFILRHRRASRPRLADGASAGALWHPDAHAPSHRSPAARSCRPPGSPSCTT